MIRRNFLKLIGAIPCVTITGGMSSLLPSRIERLKEISLHIYRAPYNTYLERMRIYDGAINGLGVIGVSSYYGLELVRKGYLNSFNKYVEEWWDTISFKYGGSWNGPWVK